nr:hypothetical protein [Dyella sp. ASV24]
MTMNTNFKGRLRNTQLPASKPLLPLFEAVVNSIHSIEDANQDGSPGRIEIEICREGQGSLDFDRRTAKPGAQPTEKIRGFRVRDDGIGFNDINMQSFLTLDSDHKASRSCRGIGRLLWLKAFERTGITSNFRTEPAHITRRTFSFTATQGVSEPQDEVVASDMDVISTEVHLDGFLNDYRERAPKTGTAIAHSVLEHCLWYFVRDGGAPSISLIDGTEVINLLELYDEYMHAQTSREQITVGAHTFDLTHVKLSHGSRNNSIAWCAAGRLVTEENLAGKIPGLHGKIHDDQGEFTYCCYVSSSLLDEHVRPERTGFDLEPSLFGNAGIQYKDIQDAIIHSVKTYLEPYLDVSRRAARARLEQFVSVKAPRYRPVLNRLADELDFDPASSDKEMELYLHRLLSRLESELVEDGHELMGLLSSESPHQYKKRLQEYLSKADDIKKSDLANYVFHRKVVLDILEKAIERTGDGKYAREDLIHELIMPMHKTSDEVFQDNYNLWLVDERLAFHNYLASDKPLTSMPIVTTSSGKEPDICVLNVFDEPILVSERSANPLASIVVVEIKRPMRNDAKAGEEKDPIEQALGYLDRVRRGEVTNAKGRPIINAENIPGYCYVICDITPTVERRCKMNNLTKASDHMGYFGYNPNFRAYIEVISFDKLLQAARERNKAFFDKLGLPT